MQAFVEILCVKLRTADIFPIITLTLKRTFYHARCKKGQSPGADGTRRLFPVRTGRLQYCCGMLSSFQSRVGTSKLVNVVQLRDTWAGSKRALSSNGSCMFATEGKSCPACECWGSPAQSCAVQAHQLCLLNVVSKRSRSYFQAKHRALEREGKVHLISFWLEMALGSWSELFGFTGCLANALVEGNAQGQSSNYWKRNGIWIWIAVRSEEYEWLHVDPASCWGGLLYDDGIMQLNKHLKE